MLESCPRSLTLACSYTLFCLPRHNTLAAINGILPPSSQTLLVKIKEHLAESLLPDFFIPPDTHELEHACLRAIHQVPPRNETYLEAHHRIGASLAAEHQLNELISRRIDATRVAEPAFSDCFIGTIKPAAEPSPTTNSSPSHSATSAPQDPPPPSAPAPAPSPADNSTPARAPPTTPTTPASRIASAKSPYDDAYTISDAEIIDLISSDDSTPDEPAPAPASVTETTKATKTKSKSKSKRRFSGHGWSKKGSKLSRRRARMSSTASSIHANSALPPSNPSSNVPASSASVASTAPNFRLPPQKSSAPSHSPMPFMVNNLPSTAIDTSGALVHEITDHATKSRKHVPPRGANPTGSRPPQPKTTHLRATYAWAEGLHTTLHYPHEFHVSLKGTPHIDASGRQHIPSLRGDLGPSAAISAVLNDIDNITRNPKSFCDNALCIYNKGDLITRRNRHLLSIRHIDSQLGRPASTQSRVSYQNTPDPKPQGDSKSKCLVLSSDRAPKTVVDSGASRHIESHISRLTNIRPCRPVVLQGINGDTFRIDRHGSAGNCHNVLLAPQASASVRSVSSLIDSHNSHVVFTPLGTFLTDPTPVPPGSIRIASRKEDGLFHLIHGSIPPPNAQVHAYLSVPQQIKREAIHRLHRMLAHASPRRMSQALKDHPELNTSLKPADTRLFTSCDACGMGNARRPSAPEKADVRATAVGYRLHLDTSGTVRPSTSSGFTRILIAVDDASRWVFVTLLRKATMDDVIAAAMRSILRKIAGDHSVLRTKYVRTDNGSEFCNRMVDALLAESDIMRELTCVGTSHQNGVAERTIGIVFAIARTIIIDAALPPTFWGEAVVTAAYVCNRLPTSANPENRSPYEIRFGRRPDLRHLRPFGITAFVRIQSHITKVQPRATKGIMIGYGESVSGQKGWRIYLPSPPRVMTTTAVTFTADLPRSISTRHPSLLSNQPPMFTPTTAAALPPIPVNNGLRLSLFATSSRRSTSVPCHALLSDYRPSGPPACVCPSRDHHQASPGNPSHRQTCQICDRLQSSSYHHPLHAAPRPTYRNPNCHRTTHPRPSPARNPLGQTRRSFCLRPRRVRHPPKLPYSMVHRR